jgi:hypothetical protein
VRNTSQLCEGCATNAVAQSTRLTPATGGRVGLTGLARGNLFYNTPAPRIIFVHRAGRLAHWLKIKNPDKPAVRRLEERLGLPGAVAQKNGRLGDTLLLEGAQASRCR